MKPSFYNLKGVHSGIAGAFLITIILIVQASHSMAGITTVTIHKRSTVIQEKILLGKISKIQGEDKYLNQKLSSIVIGRAPQPNKFRYINGKYIQIRLKQNKIDLSQVHISYPEKIEVYRDYKRVSKDEIKRIMLAYINKNIPWDKDSVRIKVINISSDLILPKGNVAYHVTPLKHWNYMGRGSIPIVFKVNNTFEKKTWVTVEVDVFGDVVISPKHLGKSTIMSK
ncbi:MAG: hypothetical protein SVY10_16065, partial [Thermodesulfobacteriota bacterium]|nr:hypothetical protein [Thermodesulfobacteriota bacterium]